MVRVREGWEHGVPEAIADVRNSDPHGQGPQSATVTGPVSRAHASVQPAVTSASQQEHFGFVADSVSSAGA